MVSHGLPVLRAGDIQKPLVDFPFHGGIKDLKELRSDVRLRTAKAWEEGWFQFGCDVASWKALVSIRWKTIFNVKTSTNGNIINYLFFACTTPFQISGSHTDTVKKHLSHYAFVFQKFMWWSASWGVWHDCISFLHALKMGKQQVYSQCKFPDKGSRPLLIHWSMPGHLKYLVALPRPIHTYITKPKLPATEV